MLGGFVAEGCFLHHAHLLDGVLSHILAELRNLLLLLYIGSHILIRLLGHHAVVRLNLLHTVDILVALENVHVGWLPFLVRQVVGGHLIVIRAKFLQNTGVAQPPVFMCHTHRRVPPDAGFHTLTDVAGQRHLVKRLKVRIHTFT